MSLEAVIKAQEARIKRLERESVRLRKGVVSDTDPLDVDLGDSGIDYESVYMVGAASAGDTVAVLSRGNGLLALGRVAAEHMEHAVLASSGDVSNSSSTATDITGCSVTLDPGRYLVSASFDIFQGNTGIHSYRLNVAGGTSREMFSGDIARGHLTKTVTIDMASSGIVKMDVRRISGGGSTTVYGTHSTLTWLRLG
jgi:hypothetical protein